MSQAAGMEFDVRRAGATALPDLVTGWTTGRARSVAIVTVAAALMGIGALMTFSASAAVPVEDALSGWGFWRLASRQLIYVGGALAAMLVMTLVPYRLWTLGGGLPALVLMGVALVACGLVFVPGIGLEINNARRWIRLGPVQFQPSELVKLAMPLLMGAWLARRRRVPGDQATEPLVRSFWSGFMPASIMLGICVVVVGLEDFGTAALVACVGGLMMLIAGARWHHLLLPILPAVPIFGYLLMSRAHRMDRLTTFMNIWADPENKGYQAIMSLCTIATGGWWGKGLGAGFTKGYLPEARSDFIFAVICEELGVIGGIAVAGLFIVFVWNGLKIVRDCGDPAGRLIAFGIAMTIGLQAAMNIAVVTVSVPTKGIALPLVSAGGTGALCLGAMVGVLANIPRRSPRVEAA